MFQYGGCNSLGMLYVHVRNEAAPAVQLFRSAFQASVITHFGASRYMTDLGSSSGMFCSTLPTRSAPTSAALV